MRRDALICLLMSCGLSILSWAIPRSSAHAATDPVSYTSPVTATIPSTSGNNDTSAPTRPILLRPTDGSVSGDATPEFVWSHSSDPNGNYIAYDVYINNHATYLGVSDTGNSAGTGYTSTIYENEVRLIPTSQLVDGVYTWYVTAYDYALNQTSSTSFTITIDTTPPPIVITDIEDYRNPIINEGSIFDIYGPQQIDIAIETEPYADIRISLTREFGVTREYTAPSGSSGKVTFSPFVDLGTYQVYVTATDHANLTTVHPLFLLDIIEQKIEIPIPGLSPPPTVVLPPYLSNLPGNIPQLPATIARITTRDRLAVLIYMSLAIAILILIFYLKYRSNMQLIHPNNQPLDTADILYTIGRSTTKYHLTPSHHGQLYIHSLRARSTLHIIHQSGTTSLCLLYPQDRYILIID